MLHWSNEYILSLINDCITENNHVEYKSEYYAPDSRGTFELLKDISAFANADGGTIILGVSQDKNGQLSTVGVETEIFDKVQSRVTSALQTSLDPALSGVDISSIESNGRTLMRISIPKSSLRPHRISKDTDSKFYLRHPGGSHPMDTQQIRQSILQSEGVFREIRSKQTERIRHISSGSWMANLRDGLLIFAVNCYPLNEIELLPEDLRSLFPIQLTFGNQQFQTIGTKHYNLEGVVYCGSTRMSDNSFYLQVFRDGSVEVVLPFGYPDRNRSLVPIGTSSLRPPIKQCFEQAIEMLQSYYPSTVAVFISVLVRQQVCLAEYSDEFHQLANGALISRDFTTSLALGEGKLQEQEIQRTLDLVFQSAGYEAAP